MKPLHNNNSKLVTYENNLCLDTRANEAMWQFLSRNSNNVTFTHNVCTMPGTFNVRNYYLNPQMDVNISVIDWTGNITYSTGASNAGNPTNATSADPLFVLVPSATPAYLNQIDLTFQGGSPAPALGIQPLSIAGIGYNGGLPSGGRSGKSISGKVGISGKVVFQ